ncbi:unnamed protein product [Cuscuta epithymum]|uniref:Uncharacterized protein n=1 Tax=Cuscuta epithymum TaxID=186058 RepID=A0AAV0G4G4_9ASTE|nr:unnamed protein product [Cuscuta epithymum]
MVLARRLQVQREGDNWIWADFHYERLPNFCFQWEILGNEDCFCLSNPHSGSWFGEKPYRSWLHADFEAGGSHPGNMWLIPSNSRPRDGRGDRVVSRRTTSEQESYAVEGSSIEGQGKDYYPGRIKEVQGH